nr:PREDICTED: predicted GPI-anchored protein 58 [Apteryx mantelli mantelli]
MEVPTKSILSKHPSIRSQMQACTTYHPSQLYDLQAFVVISDGKAVTGASSQTTRSELDTCPTMKAQTPGAAARRCGHDCPSPKAAQVSCNTISDPQSLGSAGHCPTPPRTEQPANHTQETGLGAKISVGLAGSSATINAVEDLAYEEVPGVQIWPPTPTPYRPAGHSLATGMQQPAWTWQPAPETPSPRSLTGPSSCETAGRNFAFPTELSQFPPPAPGQ